ncbi:hypothetical protein R5R35_014333 [Gryllus longicercus]|uniref:Uncharacterized protein n=1 Tax=Gryllus longicercus TaxID=2509291 RepID=A0AAN9UYQ7_9ORTH
MPPFRRKTPPAVKTKTRCLGQGALRASAGRPFGARACAAGWWARRATRGEGHLLGTCCTRGGARQRTLAGPVAHPRSLGGNFPTLNHSSSAEGVSKIRQQEHRKQMSSG